MSFRGIIVGVLVLAGMEAVLSSQQNAGRFGGLLTGLGSAIRHFLDPTIPAIPNFASVGSVSLMTGDGRITPTGQVLAGALPKHASIP